METNAEAAERGPERSGMLIPSERSFFAETVGSDLLLERLLGQAREGFGDVDLLNILEGRFRAWRMAHPDEPDLLNEGREMERDLRLEVLTAILEPYGVEDWELENPMPATLQEVVDAAYRFFVLGRRKRIVEWSRNKISRRFAEIAEECKARARPGSAETRASRRGTTSMAAAVVLADLERVLEELEKDPDPEPGKTPLEELAEFDPARYENQVVLAVLDNSFGTEEMREFLSPLGTGNPDREELAGEVRARLMEDHGIRSAES